MDEVPSVTCKHIKKCNRGIRKGQQKKNCSSVGNLGAKKDMNIGRTLGQWYGEIHSGER